MELWNCAFTDEPGLIIPHTVRPDVCGVGRPRRVTHLEVTCRDPPNTHLGKQYAVSTLNREHRM